MYLEVDLGSHPLNRICFPYHTSKMCLHSSFAKKAARNWHREPRIYFTTDSKNIHLDLCCMSWKLQRSRTQVTQILPD